MVIVKPQDYKIGFSDQFFFDTNIWILLFGTVADVETKEQKVYSKFLEDLLTKDKPIFITSGVISEFSNVLLRRDYNQWAPKSGFPNPKFKDNYVGSSEYKNSVQSINSLVKNILSLPNVVKIPDDFNAIDTENVLNAFFIVDYNDSYIAELSLMKNFKIVTNDKDFQKLAINMTIITTQLL